MTETEQTELAALREIEKAREGAMKYMEWSKVVEGVRPHVVRIMTPGVSGTGFLVSRSEKSSLCGIATAAHVVAHAHFWEQPIRIEHIESGKALLLRSADRAIFPDDSKDTAGIIFAEGDLKLPDKPFDLSPEGKTLRIGNEIGWLGFPAVAPRELCFFSGRVSAWRVGCRKAVRLSCGWRSD